MRIGEVSASASAVNAPIGLTAARPNSSRSAASQCVDDEVDLHDLVTEMEFVPEELETSMAEVCTDLEATGAVWGPRL